MHPLLRPAADRQHGVVSSRDLRRAGFGDREVRTLVSRGEWVRLRRGAYASAAALAAATTVTARLRIEATAVLLALDRPSAVLSGHSAAVLHGLPTPRGMQGLVTLTDPHQHRRGSGYEVTCAPLPAGSTELADGLPVTTLARTVTDVARTWPLEAALVVADAARWQDRLTAAELRAAVDAVAGWRGADAARRVRDLARDGAESPLETRTRLRLVADGVPEPRLQVALTADGVTAEVDGWWPEAGVAMECDGRVKYRDPWNGRTTEEAHWREKRRAEVLAAAGVRFWRVADVDLGRGWSAALARLEAMLAHPLPGPRRFTASSARRLRRTG
ncbi:MULTISPECIES: type IV toxin-antitoxin system AbiEi family antitoxin domain-containing protein [unclassified Blastococcus]